MFKPIDDPNASVQIVLTWLPQLEDATVGRFVAFLRDEASADHSLGVARARYIKGRQALRDKYFTTGRSIEMAACIMPDGGHSPAGPLGELPCRFRNLDSCVLLALAADFK